jgi:hypothetical protein
MSARSLVLSSRPASSESWCKVARVVPLPFSTFGQTTLLGRAACGALAPSGLIQINVSVRSQAHASKKVPKVEATMPEPSSMYFYLDWTKQRIDEMDATLASREAEASLMKVDSKAKADQFIADLKKRRDEFQVKAKAGLEAGEAPSQAPKRNWNPSGRRSKHRSKPTSRRRPSRSSSNRPPSALSVGLGASTKGKPRYSRCAIDCGDSNRDCRVRADPPCGSDQEGGTSALAVSRQGKERR